MLDLRRSEKNPILKPNPDNFWEECAVFNGSVVKDNQSYHMVYRALSNTKEYSGKQMQLSTIGYCISDDGINFRDRRQLFSPTENWEKFGCEDPRITKIDDEYMIFYTALSDYPFHAGAIKIGVSIFSDLSKNPEKHLVTPFNAKAMVLFPQKIQNKYVALLTVNTDIPPAYIAIAWFDKKEDLWSQEYWKNWYQKLSDYTLPLSRINSDQLEVGAVPISTPYGWLLVYAHIQHYYDNQRIFGVEAVLLDHNNPQKIIARTENPILTPQTEYEKKGIISNVTFPSGAILKDNTLFIYYGGADTTCCLATCSLNSLVNAMNHRSSVILKAERPIPYPILMPVYTHNWESKAVFNPGAFEENNIIHLIYRAMGFENTSVLGYAKSIDGLSIKERSEMPIYVPRSTFESKKNPGVGSGCEDPRITKIGETIYMCYTAYDGVNPPRVALTSIEIKDFLKGNFNWKYPVLISPPGIDDKDAAIFPEKIDGKFIIIHRIQNSIVFDKVENLNFEGNNWLRSLSYIPPRGDSWDSEKIGLCTPPIKTDHGWLILYHGVSKWSHEYRVGAMLLDLNNPEKLLSRTPWPILEPQVNFEKEGYVKNVVFPCGAILKDNTLFIYYGGADKVIGVATISFSKLLNYLLEYST